MARQEKAPAFQVYAADMLTDYAGLTHEQFGVFMRLAMYAWREAGLPDNVSQLALRVGMRIRDFQKVWDAIAPSFERQGDHLIVPFVEEARIRQATFRAKQAANGSRGGRPRKQGTDKNLRKSGGLGLGYSGESQAKAKRKPAESFAVALPSSVASTSYGGSAAKSRDGPALHDVEPPAGGTIAHAPVDGLPDAAVEFLNRFYDCASQRRRRAVAAELHATLNKGARLKGARVTAGSRDRLARKCREVLQEGVRDSDKAIVVLLTKLGDVTDASPTETAANINAQLVAEDRAALACQQAVAERFEAEHPERAARIRQTFDREHPTWTTGLLQAARASALISALATAARGRPPEYEGESTEGPAADSHRT